MKVLVIGGKGQLGKTLYHTSPNNVDLKAFDLPEINIANKLMTENIINEEKPDVIINASAYTAVDRAEEEADLAFSVNAVGPKNLAIASNKIGSRLIHISTDYVFDGNSNIPYLPSSPCNPLGVYGRSKWEGEKNVQLLSNDFVIIRTSWLYSKYGSNFVLTMLRLMQEKKELNVVADQIGSPTWASTLADAIWHVLERRNLKGLYHWCDSGVASWYDFAVAIQDEAMKNGIVQKKIPIHPITTIDFPTRAIRPQYSVLNCSQSWLEFELLPVHWQHSTRAMISDICER